MGIAATTNRTVIVLPGYSNQSGSFETHREVYEAIEITDGS